jgi:uncharacterized phage protein (TIGR02218 family)
MKLLSGNLLSKLYQEVQTLAFCWRLERTDGIILGFTSHDRDLTIDGVTYLASSGFIPTATEFVARLEVGNLNLVSFFDSESITEADILLGLYDSAQVQMFLVDYLNLPSSLSSSPVTYLFLLEGTLGRVTSTDKGFTVELRSLTQYLNQKKTQLTSPFCRYDFGDENCTVNLASYTDTLTVDAIGADNQLITTSETLTADKYKYGYLTFTTGVGAGRKLSIKGNSTNSITLFEAAPWAIVEGDEFEAVAGCEKTREACKSFSNIVNFGGEPDIPGVDEYLAGYA